MTYDRHYPPQYLAILNSLEEAKSDVGIAEGSKKSYFGRPSWWTYIEDIELHSPLVDTYDQEGNVNFIKLPKSLRLFLADTCQGNIDVAIVVIDKITTNVGFMVDITKKWELLDHLQMTGTFLRDVSGIVRSSKHRPERYADHEAPLPAPSKEIVDALHPDSAKVISSQLREFPQVRRAVIDRRPRGPSKPSFLVAGFCLVCHRACDQSGFYCQAHTRSIGTDSDIKASRRMINNAFKNLNKKLPFERTVATEGMSEIEIKKAVRARQKEWNIKKEYAFHQRCYKLEGWTKHRPEHNLFDMRINEILIEHSGAEDCESWKDIHIELFKKLIPCINSIEHMNNTFHSSFSIERTPEDLQLNLIDQVFKTDRHISVSPSDAVTMLYRMSQINLIKIASTKSGLRALSEAERILND